MDGYEAYLSLCEAATDKKSIKDVIREKREQAKALREELAEARKSKDAERIAKAQKAYNDYISGGAADHNWQAQVAQQHNNWMHQQAQQQAMADAQRAANMNASLGLSGGTNPFMFGC